MNIIYITPELWQTEEIEKVTKAFVKFNMAFDKDKMSKDSKNPFLKNSYVSLDNILNTIRPLLSANGLIITQDLAGDYITTQLMHESGQFKGSKMHFNPMKVNSGTNALQAMGGGITYAKRYALAAMLGLSADIDDDGNSDKNKTIAPKKKPATKKKVYPVINYEKGAFALHEGKTTLADIKKVYTVSASVEKVLKEMVFKLADKEAQKEQGEKLQKQERKDQNDYQTDPNSQ